MGKLGLSGMLGSGVKRVFAVVFVIALIAILLLPRQTQGLLEGISHPVAQFVAIPIQGFASLDMSIRESWNHYIALQGVYEQNLELQQEVDRLNARISQLHEQIIVSEQLASLMNFQEQAGMKTVAARVIGRNATNWYQAIIIDKGLEDGIRNQMGVVTTAGVVGRVVNVNPSTAVVLLLTDPNIAVAGMIQRSRDEGIAQGTAQGAVRMKYVPPLSTVEVGDMVVTSGLTGDYPRGLPIGRVGRLEKGDADLFLAAEIHPMVDFAKLEGVLVVTESGQSANLTVLPTTVTAQQP
ncbi:MAG: rod shape-determining protein MreC [Nitrospirales bacterium]|nr:rod shape-determining protein MreC [Nitrospira sp.]MDR4501037.1 rod shape-determining protein MreC [Nitrospirales bacterium]